MAHDTGVLTMTERLLRPREHSVLLAFLPFILPPWFLLHSDAMLGVILLLQSTLTLHTQT